MKKVQVFILILALYFSAFGGSMEWFEGSMEWYEGKHYLAQAIMEGKIILIYFSSENDDDCKRVENEFFNTEEYGDYVKIHYIPVLAKQNTGSCSELFEKFKIKKTPVILIQDLTGKEYIRINDYTSQEELFESIKSAVETLGTYHSLKVRLDKKPDDFETMLKLAELCHFTPRWSKSAELFKTIINNPERTKSLETKSRLNDKIYNVYERALFCLGLIQISKGKNPEGLNRFIKEFPSSSMAEKAKGIILRYSKKE